MQPAVLRSNDVDALARQELQRPPGIWETMEYVETAIRASYVLKRVTVSPEKRLPPPRCGHLEGSNQRRRGRIRNQPN